jgi:hypothetical protein
MKGSGMNLRAVLAAAAFVLAGAAQAQTSSSASGGERSSAPAPTEELQDAALLQALRRGGYVIYFRHTTTDFSKRDDAMTSFEGCANQRLLSEQGRHDARMIGRQIAALRLPVGDVFASPMCRTMEHAQLSFGADVPKPAPAMREGAQDEHPGLRRMLGAPVTPRTNRWLVGHGNPFRAVAGPPHLAEGEAVVLRPDGGGEWTVVARLKVADWTNLSRP